MAGKGAGWVGWAIAAVLGIALIGRCGSDASPPGSTASTNGEASEVAARWLYVQADSLNCRQGRSTSAPSVGGLTSNTRVGVIEEQEGWSRISHTPTCWVRSSYLGETERAPQRRPLAAYSAAVETPRRAARQSSGSSYYQNCSAARAAGAAPVMRGEPGYSRRLDRDGDGVGCE